MIDRRGFLGLMLGTAVAPKNVLAGLETPAPVKQAMTFAWEFVGKIEVENLSENELIAAVVHIGFKTFEAGSGKLTMGSWTREKVTT